jgi:outer membrane autotransporter protein
MAGLALAYEHTGFSIDGPSNSGSIDTARAAAYGAAAAAGLRFAGVGAVSFDQFDVSRSLPTFSRTASSSYDGWTLAFSGEASRPFAVGTATLEPLAGLSMVQAWRAGFTEAGAGALSLSVERGDFTKVASRLGAEFGLRWAVSDGVLLRPWLRGAWAHDFADAVSDFSASLAGATAPGTFTIQSVDTGRDAALLSAGFTLDLSARASITVAYQGELRHDAQAHSISGTGTLRW